MNNNEIIKNYLNKINEILKKKLPNYTKKQIIENVERKIIPTPRGLVESYYICGKCLFEAKLTLKEGRIDYNFRVK